MSNIQHLDSLSVIHADFDIWSGQTRLSASDLKLGVGGEIPPEKLASLGNKRIFPSEKLKGFHRLKTKARRILAHYGMPFMNGFAVPAGKVDTICKQLDLISDEFDELRKEVIASYDKAIDQWCVENPGYETIIQDASMPKDVVEDRIGFDYQVFMIQPVADNSATAARLGRKVKGLGDDLFSEIESEANKFYETKLAGKSEVGISTQQTLKNIRDKVDGLSFLNNAFIPLVNLLDETINGYKQHSQGRHIVAPFLYQVVAVVLIMSDRSKIEGYANGNVTVAGVASDVGNDDGPLPTLAQFGATVAGADSGQDAHGSDDDNDAVSTDAPSGDAPVDSDSSASSESDVSPESLLEDMDSFFADFTDAKASEETKEAPEASTEITPNANPASTEGTKPNVGTDAEAAETPKPEDNREQPSGPQFDDDDDFGSW